MYKETGIITATIVETKSGEIYIGVNKGARDMMIDKVDRKLRELLNETGARNKKEKQKNNINRQNSRDISNELQEKIDRLTRELSDLGSYKIRLWKKDKSFYEDVLKKYQLASLE